MRLDKKNIRLVERKRMNENQSKFYTSLQIIVTFKFRLTAEMERHTWREHHIKANTRFVSQKDELNVTFAPIWLYTHRSADEC